MSNIELSTAESDLLAQIAATLRPSVLTEYPTTDAYKAGQCFSYQGEDWEYLTQEKITANNWDLVEGYPLPVKGFFEINLKFEINPEQETGTVIAINSNVIINELDYYSSLAPNIVTQDLSNYRFIVYGSSSPVSNTLSGIIYSFDNYNLVNGIIFNSFSVGSIVNEMYAGSIEIKIYPPLAS